MLFPSKIKSSSLLKFNEISRNLTLLSYVSLSFIFLLQRQKNDNSSKYYCNKFFSVRAYLSSWLKIDTPHCYMYAVYKLSNSTRRCLERRLNCSKTLPENESNSHAYSRLWAASAAPPPNVVPHLAPASPVSAAPPAFRGMTMPASFRLKPA